MENAKMPATVGLEKRKYSGALVLEPESKSYTTPIEIFDVKGLYPTVMILHNLSFETVCCDCCKDNSAARVPQSIMDSINNSLRQKIKSQAFYEKEKRKERYWICIKNKGAIPNMLLKFKQQREYYRQKGYEPMSQALKVMMNSIYGLFGSDGIFAFQDYRAAELVTAFARLKLLEMKQIANDRFQMKIIYGDTDSIFVSGTSNTKYDHNLPVTAFTAACKQNLGVDVDHQNTFVRSILISKKHYIGIQADGKVIIKGMEGKKRDRPPFFNQVFSQLIDDYRNNNNYGLVSNVLKAFKLLEAAEVDPSLLAYSIILNKDPDDYKPYTAQYKIGKSLNKEPGNLIKYYKTGAQEDGYKGYSTNYQDLDIDTYKTELWNLIKDVLILLDCDVQKLQVQIFPTTIEDYVTFSDTIFTGRANKKSNISNNARKTSNIQRNDSLDNYRCLYECLIRLALSSI
jgi:DNA polymerase, archaea type